MPVHAILTTGMLPALKVVCGQAASAPPREYLAREYLSQTYEHLFYDMFQLFYLIVSTTLTTKGHNSVCPFIQLFSCAHDSPIAMSLFTSVSHLR